VEASKIVLSKDMLVYSLDEVKSDVYLSGGAQQPCNALQAEERCHRKGSIRVVVADNRRVKGFASA